MSIPSTPPPPSPSSLRRRLPLRLGYLVLAGFMVLFGYAYVQKTHEIQTLSRQEAALRAENNQTAADNARVSRAIKWYRTTKYVEDTARSDLGYTLPGEISVQVQPIRQKVVERAAPPRPAATPLPTWQQWLNAFNR